MNRKVHLISANSKNPYGMEYFVKKSFISIGYEVLCTDYRKMSKEEVSNRIKYVTDVDFLLGIKCERVCPEDIFACRVPTILWLQDSVEANQEANFIIQTKAPLFDLVYSFNKAELPFYKQYNKNSHYLPLAADKDTHLEVNIEKTIDVGLVGNLNTNRINMINHLLDKGIPIQYSYSQQNYAELVSKTKINLNIGITSSGYQMRVFEILKMGGFLLTNKVKDEDLFVDKEHLVYYNDFNHLCELIYYYMDRPEERQRISNSGQHFVLNNHTYVNRIKEIIDKIRDI